MKKPILSWILIVVLVILIEVQLFVMQDYVNKNTISTNENRTSITEVSKIFTQIGEALVGKGTEDGNN